MYMFLYNDILCLTCKYSVLVGSQKTSPQVGDDPKVGWCRATLPAAVGGLADVVDHKKGAHIARRRLAVSESYILLMEEILHQLIRRFTVFFTSRWCRISSINITDTNLTLNTLGTLGFLLSE